MLANGSGSFAFFKRYPPGESHDRAEATIPVSLAALFCAMFWRRVA
jgi:hypothetical protein